MPTHIVSPLWVEVVVQEDGTEKAEFQRGARSEPLEDLPGATVLLVRVGAYEVEVELVEGSLGQEIGAAGEGFQIEELIFDEAVDGLDIALIGVGGGRDALVLAVA